MKQSKSRAFTLIELIATLVIMAIIALIATPLVMNIIRKARVSADKRSVDAYGRSIELAIAGYLLDTGKFPTEVSQLTIEYSGNEVVCETTQIKSDSSVYLAGCTVAGRSTGDYTYGTKEEVTYDYKVGDLVTYNGVNYRVLKDVKSTDTKATLLKAEPLKVAEVNEYGAGHVNMNVQSSESYYQTAYDINGYGGMQYYSSTTCGYNGTDWVYDGCKNDYASSEIKYVVDAWKEAKAPAASEARLISKQEIDENFEFEEYKPCGDACGVVLDKITADWMYNINSSYWTMSQYNDSASNVWYVLRDGSLYYNSVSHSSNVVRPVIIISKSNLSIVGN